MVDADRVRDRLARLEVLLLKLDEVRTAGEVRYLADIDLRLQGERALQLAIQICIDLGAQLLSESAAPPPRDYGSVFRGLAEAGRLPSELAERLARAAAQHNLLVHDYLDLDDRLVFASLQRLDDLRAFAAVVLREADG